MRSVAVHVALEQSFFNPFETVQAYLWRNALIHGAPTRHVNEKELADIAEDREIWAFRVLSDYLRLAAEPTTNLWPSTSGRGRTTTMAGRT